mmetsp:Transcript_13327/g.28813  ORF Transcript_13327/g.28813 Transcript_13327/m.28813 type:complete len:273 (+) Transcript_13327:1306-2124(+)
MPQHSPVEEDLAQRAHCVGEEDVHEGHRARYARPQAEAAGVDQLEGPVEHRGARRAYPRGRGDGQGYSHDDRAVEGEYRADGRATYDVDPHHRGQVQEEEEGQREDDELRRRYLFSTDAAQRIGSVMVVRVRFVIAAAGRGGGAVTAVALLQCKSAASAAGAAQIAGPRLLVSLVAPVAPVLPVRLPLLDQIQREDVGVVDAEEAEEGHVHPPQADGGDDDRGRAEEGGGGALAVAEYFADFLARGHGAVAELSVTRGEARRGEGLVQKEPI